MWAGGARDGARPGAVFIGSRRGVEARLLSGEGDVGTPLRGNASCVSVLLSTFDWLLNFHFEASSYMAIKPLFAHIGKGTY